jgi:uncharacterized protein
MLPPSLRDDKRTVSVRILVASLLVVLSQLPLLGVFPRPAGYVNDFASLLDEPAEAYLETFLRTLERDTSAEVVVATVQSLDGRTVEDYAHELFAEWGIGKKGHDNGVLLLVASTDRTVRIEIGYGLEPILPDGLAGEIIRAEMIPEFQNGNFPRGIGRGLNRIAQIVRRDPSVARSTAPPPDDGTGVPPAVVMVPFLASFILLGAFAAGLGLRTKTYLPLVWGGIFAGIPLLMLAANWSIVSIAVLVPLGLAALAVGYRKGWSPYWVGILRQGPRGQPRDDDGLAWEAGGTPGSTEGGSSDASGSSTGVDFGGGSSGGGGASGRW